MTTRNHYIIHAITGLAIIALVVAILQKPKEIINPLNKELEKRAVRLKNDLDSIRVLVEDYRVINDSLEAAKPKIEYKYITRQNEIIDYSNSDAINRLRDEIAGYNP